MSEQAPQPPVIEIPTSRGLSERRVFSFCEAMRWEVGACDAGLTVITPYTEEPEALTYYPVDTEYTRTSFFYSPGRQSGATFDQGPALRRLPGTHNPTLVIDLREGVALEELTKASATATSAAGRISTKETCDGTVGLIRDPFNHLLVLRPHQ